MADLAYSYHNFIFPFIWKNNIGENNKHGFKDVTKMFKEDVWGNDDLSELNWNKIKIDNTDIQDDGLNVNRLKYATFQYFQPAVRDALFGPDNPVNGKKVVKNFYFKPLKNERLNSTRQAKYIISKDKDYKLDLTDIKLRLYNTGVGLLVFICENREEYNSSLADIININEYGRRIALPFIPSTEAIDSSVCSDFIEIWWDGIKGNVGQHFRDLITNINDSGQYAEQNHIANFIVDILNYSNNKKNSNSCQFCTDKKAKGNYWCIEPALDDRMFVMCAVNKNYQKLFATEDETITPFDYLTDLTSENLNSSYKKSSYEQMEKSLYEFIFCDPFGKCSCYFPKMRQQLIREHLYSRWIAPQWGTLYSMAAQAFTCVSDYNVILDYFRTEYYEMVSLVLAQRTSLRAMQNEASDLSSDIEKDDNDVDKEKRKKIANLQEKLIAFQNQINLYEISSQEQAIELYDMMRDVFLVNKHTSMLQEQLDGLYNIANIHQNESFSQLAVKIAIIALIIALPSFINDFAFLPDEWHIGTEGYFEKYSGFILLAKAILVSVIMIILFLTKLPNTT